MENKKINRSIQFKNGSYSVIITLIAIAIFVVINLTVAKLPASVTKFSTSEVNYYSLGDTTKNFLKNDLNSDITLYILSDSIGSYDEYVLNLCENYKNASSRVELKKIDVAVNPGFAGKYSALSASGYSVIVENKSTGNYKLIDYTEMYTVKSKTDSNGISSNVYSYDGEGLITAAMNQVTNEKQVKIYQLTGHNEDYLSDDNHQELKSALEKNSCVFADELLDLNTSDIPSDCGLLMIYRPLTDLTANDTSKVEQYINNGGNVIIVYNNILPFIGGKAYYDAHTNLNELLAYVGVQVEEGYILEKDSSHFYSAAGTGAEAYLLPDKNQSSSLTTSLLSSTVMTGYSSPVKKLESANVVSYTELLKTSKNYSLVLWNGGDSYAVDYNSPACIASYIETKGNANGHIMVVGCSMFYDGINYDTSLVDGNIKLTVNAVADMNGNVSNIFIEPKTLERKFNAISSGNATLFSIIYIGLIPALVLVIGFAVWFVRRSK